jgi:glutaredoxin
MDAVKLFHRAPVRHTVTLLTKPGCHLCHKARATVSRLTAELGVPLTELNIEEDESLRARYWEKIPVTLVDDEEFAVWHVDEQKLRRALGG